MAVVGIALLAGLAVGWMVDAKRAEAATRDKSQSYCYGAEAPSNQRHARHQWVLLYGWENSYHQSVVGVWCPDCGEVRLAPKT